MSTIIKRLSNDEVLDLDSLSVQELFKLHYDEEVFVAQEVQKLPPLSKDREECLREGYELIREIQRVRAIKLTGAPQKSFGTSDRRASFLIKLIAKKIKKTPTEKVTVYEAGVGTGYAIKKILEHFSTSELDIKGCDVQLEKFVCELAKANANVDIEEGHVYDNLCKLPDESIDVFYADNVFEHFLPDEAETIYKELAKKLKINANVFLVIPNIHIGPIDISKHFLPMGEKPQGFHFMEMSFNEITELMRKFNIRHTHCVFRIPYIHTFVVKSSLLVWLKLKFEYFFSKIPNERIKRGVFVLGCYNTSIMIKHSNSS